MEELWRDVGIIIMMADTAPGGFSLLDTHAILDLMEFPVSCYPDLVGFHKLLVLLGLGSWHDVLGRQLLTLLPRQKLPKNPQNWTCIAEMLPSSRAAGRVKSN